MISGEIGIRKPAPEIYALAAERLGRPPERIVFVDDLRRQPQARARDRDGDGAAPRRRSGTVAELEEHLGVSLR